MYAHSSVIFGGQKKFLLHKMTFTNNLCERYFSPSQRATFSTFFEVPRPTDFSFEKNMLRREEEKEIFFFRPHSKKAGVKKCNAQRVTYFPSTFLCTLSLFFAFFSSINLKVIPVVGENEVI